MSEAEWHQFSKLYTKAACVNPNFAVPKIQTRKTREPDGWFSRAFKFSWELAYLFIRNETNFMFSFLNALLGPNNGDDVGVIICPRKADASGSILLKLRKLFSLLSKNKPMVFLRDLNLLLSLGLEALKDFPLGFVDTSLKVEKMHSTTVQELSLLTIVLPVFP